MRDICFIPRTYISSRISPLLWFAGAESARSFDWLAEEVELLPTGAITCLRIKEIVFFFLCIQGG